MDMKKINKTKPYMKRIFSFILIMAALASSCTTTDKDSGKIIDKLTPEEIVDGHLDFETVLRLGRISDPQVSPNLREVLYGVTYTSVEENRSNRDLFIVGIDGSNCRRITQTPKSESNARWINDGHGIMFLYEGQIWVMDADGKNRRKVSDIEGDIGEFKLAPDGHTLVYVKDFKVAKKAAEIYPDLPKSTARTIENMMYRHWDHFVEDIPHTYVADFDGEKLGEGVDILGGEPFELPTMPFSGLEQIDFSPNSKYIAYSCRKKTGRDYAFSTNTDIYLYNIETGETQNLTEGMPGYDTNPVFSPDGRWIAWLSMDRDGYEADQSRLFVMLFETGEKRNLSKSFIYNAENPVWHPSCDFIYFDAEVDGRKRIFEATMGASISQVSGNQIETYNFAHPQMAGHDTIVAERASMLRPTELVTIDLAGSGDDEKVITHENDELIAALKPIQISERWIKTVDGKKMHSWVLYPPQFSYNKQYPAIMVCLGGPQGAFTQSWSTRWNYRFLASQGYVVILPNRRGTTSSGQEWCEQISGDYMGLNIQDYLSAADDICKERYVGKIAAIGASYGGFSVYYLAGVHQKRFSAFVAHAGIFNQEHMYMETEEMWFPDWDNGGCRRPGEYMAGSPWSKNPAAVHHYANSAHKKALNWDTPILVTHGELDYRVPVDQGMAAFNTAQMLGVPSKMVLFPDENHWVLKPQNAVHWWREIFDWLDRWCKEK